MAGLDIKEGDYLLAVNGMPVDTSKDPFAAFQGLAGTTISLTVNNEPTAAIDTSLCAFILPPPTACLHEWE